MPYLHIYTGDGKGKTTASIGLIVRAAGAGKRAAFVQFDKGFDTDEHYAERAILRQLPGVTVQCFGAERLMPDGKFRFKNEPQDFEQAQRGLEAARHLAADPVFFTIVLDEVITCIKTKLLKEADVMKLIEEWRRAPHAELILTGRNASPRLIEAADLVTECREVKHYFHKGVHPRFGIDY